MIGGIDEAGRGPVIGPLVVAGVACPEPSVLEEMGVKDSKRVPPAKRVRLDRLIRDHPDTVVVVEAIEAEQIDGLREQMSLNQIEVQAFSNVATQLEATELYLDAADVDAERFGRRVAHELKGNPRTVSEHRADDRYPIVAAASIIAKVARDNAIAELARRLERQLDYELGSGYPGDAKTRSFLAAWHAEFGDVPPGTRKSWATVKALLVPQSKLSAF